MANPIQLRLQEARIPPQAYRTNLATLGQALLRSIIDDGMFQVQGDLKSFSLVQERTDLQHFSTIVARFAAELLLKGNPVYYFRAAAIDRELRAYVSEPSGAGMSPVLSRLGKGFIVVPDVCSGLMDASWPAPDLCDFLIEHVSLGGGLILGRQVTAEWQGAPVPIGDNFHRELTGEFEATVSTFTRVGISSHDSLRSA